MAVPDLAKPEVELEPLGATETRLEDGAEPAVTVTMTVVGVQEGHAEQVLAALLPVGKTGLPLVGAGEVAPRPAMMVLRPWLTTLPTCD